MALLGGSVAVLIIIYSGWQIISGLMEDVAEKPYVSSANTAVKPFNTSLLDNDVFKAMILYGPEKVEGEPDGNLRPFFRSK